MCVRACVYQKTYVSTGINIVEMPFNEVTVLIYYACDLQFQTKIKKKK